MTHLKTPKHTSHEDSRDFIQSQFISATDRDCKVNPSQPILRISELKITMNSVSLVEGASGRLNVGTRFDKITHGCVTLPLIG